MNLKYAGVSIIIIKLINYYDAGIIEAVPRNATYG